MIRMFVTSSLKKEMMEPDSEASAHGEDENTRLKEIPFPARVFHKDDQEN